MRNLRSYAAHCYTIGGLEIEIEIIQLSALSHQMTFWGPRKLSSGSTLSDTKFTDGLKFDRKQPPVLET